jgi:ABC-type transport system involved in multi-copper enzyme maturation permease subunit
MTRLVRAELAKLRTTRLVYGVAAAMTAFGILTVVANVTTAGHQGSPPLAADSLVPLVGAPVTLLAGAALLLGILGMAGEFRHQTITQTFLATPNRGWVVAAKLVVLPLAAVAVTLVTLAVTAAVAAGWLAAEGITPSLAGAGLGRLLAGAVLASALFAMLGVGVGALFRNQVTALVGTVAWVLVVEGLLLSLLHAPSLAKWLPSAAAAAITNPGGDHLSQLGGVLVAGAYALVLAVAGTRFVVRRDVT